MSDSATKSQKHERVASGDGVTRTSGYTYDFKTNTYHFPGPTLANMIRRIQATKEACEQEDQKENERRRIEALAKQAGKR